ncbi:preprotein translocase SecE subunit [Bacteroides sp. CAG:927]|jgi:preprotein translocase subunit SecE|nr:preprotein translocase SecE subunit [Bacteroides sp. CAG:927]
MKKLKLLTDIEESYNELRYKTSWPTGTQLIKSALIVLIASIILSVIIWCMDEIVDSLMHFIYNLPNLFGGK